MVPRLRSHLPCGVVGGGEIVEETGHEKVAALTVCTLRSGQVWASVGESVSPSPFLFFFSCSERKHRPEEEEEGRDRH